MRNFVVSFLFLLMIPPVFSATDLGYIRKLFFEASQSPQKTDIMLQLLNRAEDKYLPVLKGYTGMSYMLLAKHGFNFIARYNNFQQGKELLERAIHEDKNNVELRFLRLSVQMNVPIFLNYSTQIENDKQFIVAHFNSLKDADLKERIFNYFKKKNLSLS